MRRRVGYLGAPGGFGMPSLLVNDGDPDKGGLFVASRGRERLIVMNSRGVCAGKAPSSTEIPAPILHFHLGHSVSAYAL